MCTVLLPSGGNPIAFNKYIIVKTCITYANAKLLKQSLVIYVGFGCCASLSGVIGDYAVQNYLKWGNVRVA
jgi:hypothetical protein